MSYDPAKRRKNLRKHRVHLPGCEAAFNAPMLTREVWADREKGATFLAERPNHMSKRHISRRTRRADIPYNAEKRAEVLKYWKGATRHRGLEELRAKRGRPALAAHERKEQVALRLDREVVAWYRAQGAGWQTRMNKVLRAFKDATR